MEKITSENGFTFDTCVGIKNYENPNFGSLLSTRINFENSTIHICSQTVFEASRLGYDVYSVSGQIKKSTGARVVTRAITEEIQDNADYLESIYPTLHYGDSQILAYSMAMGTTLITCDKGLAEVAKISGAKVINPDLLPCDKIRQNVKSKMQKIVQRVRGRHSETKQKVKSLALKPGQKIVWRAFQ